MSTTQQPLVFDSDRGAPRPARPDEPLAVGALAVAAGVGQFGQPPPSAPKALTGDWGATLQAVIQQLLDSGAATDFRNQDWLDELQAAVVLSQLGPYQSGRIIIGSSQGWTALDQPVAVSGLLQALVARSGATEQIAPGVSAVSLGYADVVAYGEQEPTTAVDGTLWFSENPEQGAQVRSPVGWRRFEDLLREASTALRGLVRLADAAAITNGTPGRVVDAAQLWAVRAMANAAQAAADGAQAAADAAQAKADSAWQPVDATTTSRGLVRLADDAAISAGTATRVVDAAQLKAVRDGVWAPVNATETVWGLVRLADAAAITAGAAGLVVDAAQLKESRPGAASESAAGLVQFASAADVAAGVSASRAVSAAQLKAELDRRLESAVAPGMIAWFPRQTPPSGYLKANGAAVSRTAYAALYMAIGTIHGIGNGSTTFNLPDLRGEFIRGWDDGRYADPGRGLASWQADAYRSHSHYIPGAILYGYNAGESGALRSGSGSNGSDPYYAYTWADGGAETRPRNIALLACIKY